MINLENMWWAKSVKENRHGRTFDPFVSLWHDGKKKESWLYFIQIKKYKSRFTYITCNTVIHYIACTDKIIHRIQHIFNVTPSFSAPT